jgi:pyridoxamine 5'-phosphate oxidase
MDELRARDPVEIFKSWLVEAEEREPDLATAMCLATVDAAGHPSARMVLLKGADDRGFVFFTNFESRKGADLLTNPTAALCFHWKSLRRQVLVRGPVEPVSEAEADAYHASRARESQIGAWASDQSRPLDSRATLEARMAVIEARYAGGPVPRPPNWSGFRLAPVTIEFWHERPHRLHDRILFTHRGGAWTSERLYP